jgi:hypothetical protein
VTRRGPRSILFAACIGAVFATSGQEYYENTARDTLARAAARALPTSSIGLGLGIDYGGIGAHVAYAPHDNLQLILGLGYALAGFGINAGVQGRLLTGGRARPFVGAVYGYNAVIVVQGASEYDQLYYGPSFRIASNSGAMSVLSWSSSFLA